MKVIFFIYINIYTYFIYNSIFTFINIFLLLFRLQHDITTQTYDMNTHKHSRTVNQQKRKEYTHTHIYIIICVCMCVCGLHIHTHTHVYVNKYIYKNPSKLNEGLVVQDAFNNNYFYISSNIPWWNIWPRHVLVRIGPKQNQKTTLTTCTMSWNNIDVLLRL